MQIENAIFMELASLLGGLFSLYYLRARANKRFEPSPSKDRIFRCRQCAFVYTDDADVDRSRCPHCGMNNESVKF